MPTADLPERDARRVVFDRLAELEVDEPCELLPEEAFRAELENLSSALCPVPPLDPDGGRLLTIARPYCPNCGHVVDYVEAISHAVCSRCGSLYPDWLEPQHSLLVFAERFAKGYQVKHPDDCYLEESMGGGVTVHRVDGSNGVAVTGRPILLGGRA